MHRALPMILVALVAAGCGLDLRAEAPTTTSASDATLKPPPPTPSAHGPHFPSPGPWFEGWYTRITDEAGSRSLAVIVSSHLPKDAVYVPGMALPGYIAVLVSEGGGAPTLSFEVFPEETYASIDGEPVGLLYSLVSVAEFEWTAPGFGTITESGIDLAIPGQVEVRAEWQGGIEWNSFFLPVGPEGVLAGLPLPLHWHVESLGSDARYEYLVQADGHAATGSGYAHQEKNWGSAFPSAWVWSQGIDDDNEAQFVLGGGDVELGPTSMRAWLVGFRSPEIALDFNYYTPGTVFQTTIDACAGTFTLEAADPLHTLTVEATGPIGTFGSVSIPTADGFHTDAGGESFSSTVTVSAYRHDPLSGLLGAGELVAVREFENAALEFGADFRCQK